jgi:glycosyltransferase involved in cell wall biosynthesis
VVHRLNLLTEVLAAQRGKDITGRLFWPLERRGWERYDRDTMRSASLAITNTDEVAAALVQRYPQTRTVALPSGTDLRQLRNPPSSGKDAIFIGWMSYEPNLDAATWFAREVWPAVRARHPEACVRIVGRDPGPDALALHRPDHGVIVTGEVPDVADAAEGCRLGVVPLRRGRGMKTKTIELMAMGLPVVSLPAGREGIAATPDEGLLAPADASDMAAEIIRLLGEPGRADGLGETARRWVTAHHGWDAIAARYRELLGGVSR